MADPYLREFSEWRKGEAIDVRELKEVQREIEQKIKDLHGPEMLLAIRTATLLVQRDAKINAPVNTGRLRASIVPSVMSHGDVIEGIVGSNVTYAPYVEFGTKPHWPPLAPIMRWVHLKKLAGTYSIKTKRRTGGATRQRSEDYIVAKWIQKAIAERGTKPQEYLKKAFEKNVPRIQQMFDITVQRVIEK